VVRVTTEAKVPKQEQQALLSAIAADVGKLPKPWTAAEDEEEVDT